MKNNKLASTHKVNNKLTCGVPTREYVHHCGPSDALRSPLTTHAPFRQSGLTLLEIMVTLVILSLGLLGLAGLQMTGLKNNRNAYYSSVAGQVVQDIAERIKADQAGANDPSTFYDAIEQAADNSVCDAENPTFANRAACLAAALPNGRVLVTRRAGAPKSFFVALRWTDIALPTGAHGWNDANASAVAACDTPTDESNDNVNCHYTVVMP